MQDTELHKLYNYAEFLLKKLPRERSSDTVELDNEVTLEYYRIEQTASSDYSLGKGDNEPIKGATDVGTGGQSKEEKESLSEIVKICMRRYLMNILVPTLQKVINSLLTRSKRI